MTLKHLEFFKKTAELENISKAAEELFIAQPALSKAIKDLETDLGYPLFDRNGKKIILNHNGEILYKYVLQIQSNVTNMESELLEANVEKSSTVSISIRVASRLLPEILSNFYAKYPDTNLKINQMNQAIKNLPEYDVILDSNPNNKIDCVHKEVLLMEERILVALPASHPLAAQKKITFSDLKGQPCSFLNELSSLGKMVRTALKAHHFMPNIIFESDNPHMIRDFLKLDLSYSFVPEKTWLIKKDFPNMVLREVEGFNCNRYIYLSYGHNNYVSQSTKDFVRLVKEYFKGIS